jgi:hypothetical protein
MNIKPASKIVAIVVLCSGAAVGTAGELQVLGRDSSSFISPVTLRLVLPEGDPRRPALCQKVRCPPILNYGGQSAGGIPTCA